jgi:hypothetical protein
MKYKPGDIIIIPNDCTIKILEDADLRSWYHIQFLKSLHEYEIGEVTMWSSNYIDKEGILDLTDQTLADIKDFIND